MPGFAERAGFDPEDQDPQGADLGVERGRSFTSSFASQVAGMAAGFAGSFTELFHDWKALPHEFVRRLAPLDPIDTLLSLGTHALNAAQGYETPGQAVSGYAADVKKTFLEHSPVAKLARGLHDQVDEASKEAGGSLWGTPRERAQAQGRLAATAVLFLASLLIPAAGRGATRAGEVALGTARAARAAEATAAANAKLAAAGARAEAEAATLAAAEAKAARASGIRGESGPSRSGGTAAAAPVAREPAAAATVPAAERGGLRAPPEAAASAPAADSPLPEARAPPEQPCDGIAQRISPDTPRGEASVREPGAPAPAASDASATTAPRGQAPARDLGALGEEEPALSRAKRIEQAKARIGEHTTANAGDRTLDTVDPDFHWATMQDGEPVNGVFKVSEIPCSFMEVNPEVAGGGIGKTILRRHLDYWTKQAQGAGCRQVRFEFDAATEAGAALCEKNGFTITGKVPQAKATLTVDLEGAKGLPTKAE